MTFAIHSDHKPLSNLFTAEMKNARVQRWAIVLSEYGGDIQYETGKTQKADMLSRVKANLENDGLDLDTIQEMVDVFEVNGIDTDEPQEIGAPEFLDDNEEIVLDKGEKLLQADMAPLSTLQREDECLAKIIEGVGKKDKKYNDFVIYEDTLYHVAHPVKPDNETSYS